MTNQRDVILTALFVASLTAFCGMLYNGVHMLLIAASHRIAISEGLLHGVWILLTGSVSLLTCATFIHLARNARMGLLRLIPPVAFCCMASLGALMYVYIFECFPACDYQNWVFILFISALGLSMLCQIIIFFGACVLRPRYVRIIGFEEGSSDEEGAPIRQPPPPPPSVLRYGAIGNTPITTMYPQLSSCASPQTSHQCLHHHHQQQQQQQQQQTSQCGPLVGVSYTEPASTITGGSCTMPVNVMHHHPVLPQQLPPMHLPHQHSLIHHTVQPAAATAWAPTFTSRGGFM